MGQAHCLKFSINSRMWHLHNSCFVISEAVNSIQTIVIALNYNNALFNLLNSIMQLEHRLLKTFIILHSNKLDYPKILFYWSKLA